MIYIYHYDNFGLNRDVRTEANMSPLEPTVPLVPRNATLIEPIKSESDHVILRFDSLDNQWNEISDYRGYVYWTPKDGKGTVTEVDQWPPVRALELLTPILWDKDLNAWRLRSGQDDLEDHKLQINKTNSATAEKLKAAFFSAEPGSNKLRNKQIFYVIRYLELKEQETAPNYIMTATDIAELVNLKTIKDDIRTIISFENRIEVSVNAAISIDDVNIAGDVSWPVATYDPSITIN